MTNTREELIEAVIAITRQLEEDYDDSCEQHDRDYLNTLGVCQLTAELESLTN